VNASEMASLGRASTSEILPVASIQSSDEGNSASPGSPPPSGFYLTDLEQTRGQIEVVGLTAERWRAAWQ